MIDISDTITRETILLFLFSFGYNVIIQLLYCFSKSGKFETNGSRYSTGSLVQRSQAVKNNYFSTREDSSEFQSDILKMKNGSIARSGSIPILHYLFMLGDALVITGIFWYLKINNILILDEIILLVSGLCLFEGICREIKSKNFNLKRLMVDIGFNIAAIAGTYLIFLKFQT